MVTDDAAAVLFDGLIGAFVASVATVIAVGLTIGASRKQTEKARLIDLALQTGTLAYTVELLIATEELGVQRRGTAEYRQWQLMVGGLIAMARKSDSTFAEGLAFLQDRVKARMPEASKVLWRLDHQATNDLRDALLAIAQWIVWWLGTPESLPSRRHTVEEALANARDGRLGLD